MVVALPQALGVAQPVRRLLPLGLDNFGLLADPAFALLQEGESLAHVAPLLLHVGEDGLVGGGRRPAEEPVAEAVVGRHEALATLADVVAVLGGEDESLGAEAGERVLVP